VQSAIGDFRDAVRHLNAQCVYTQPLSVVTLSSLCGYDCPIFLADCRFHFNTERFDSFYILIIFIKCHLFRAIDFGRKSIEPLISVENQSNGTFRHRKCNEHASSWSLNDPQLIHGAQNCVFYAKCSIFSIFYEKSCQKRSI
jgi:hypothetical protein